MRQHLRIDGVCFGQPPARAGELAHGRGFSNATGNCFADKRSNNAAS
jgi:hypothetical protein